MTWNQDALALLLCAAALAGCSEAEHPHGPGGHGEHAEGEEAHPHGEGVAIGITRWSDTLELFAEHPPAVVGVALPFLAHMTVLEGFEALEDATVRLTLRGPAELSAEAPMLRSGIYRPTLTPTVAGSYQGSIEIIAGGQGVIGDFDVEVYPDQASADAAHPPDEGDGGSITFLKEQQWRVPFDTAFSATRSMRPRVEVTGILTTPPAGMAPIHAPVAGRVMATRSGFPSAGMRVRAGELLATLAPTPGSPENAANAGLAVVEAESRLEASRLELARTERMLADQAIPERRLEDARRGLAVAEAAVGAARHAQSVYTSAQSGRGRGGWRITSPIDGVVDAVDVSPGESVDAGDRLFQVVNLDTLWVEAEVPETWASAFVEDASASFAMVGESVWHPIDLGGEPASRLVYRSRVVDPTSRTVRVVYELAAPHSTLRVGASLDVLLPAGEPIEAVSIPRSAVLDIDGRDVVFVQVEGEAFSERAVRTGPTDGAHIAILGGIDEGERVVTEGAHLLRLASSAGASVGHGHVH